MKFLKTAQRRVGIGGELLSFFMGNKRWWLLPMMLVLLLFGIIIIVGQSSALAPLLYPLF